MDKGLLCLPDYLRGLEYKVDADFAGGWEYGHHANHNAVLSWTGL